MNKKIIKLHTLTSFPPSNLNRDREGTPKSAWVGDVVRARVSSQCVKRAIRTSDIFKSSFGENLLAMRTRHLPSLVRLELESRTKDKEEIAAIVARVPEIGRESLSSKKGKKGKSEAAQDSELEAETETGEGGSPEEEETIPITNQLIFFHQREVASLADGLLEIYRSLGDEEWESCPMGKITRELPIATNAETVDVALFGRMVTSLAFNDADAAVQTAHVLSVGREYPQEDFLSTADDLVLDGSDWFVGVGQQPPNGGSGFISSQNKFVAPTMYGFYTIDWDKLLRNLNGQRALAERVVLAFLEAAISVRPSGKQNSYAAHPLPDFVMVEVGPLTNYNQASYWNAFHSPIKAKPDSSQMREAIIALSQEVESMQVAYPISLERAFFSTLRDLPDLNLSDQVSGLRPLLNWVSEQLKG